MEKKKSESSSHVQVIHPFFHIMIMSFWTQIISDSDNYCLLWRDNLDIQERWQFFEVNSFFHTKSVKCYNSTVWCCNLGLWMCTIPAGIHCFVKALGTTEDNTWNVQHLFTAQLNTDNFRHAGNEPLLS